MIDRQGPPPLLDALLRNGTFQKSVVVGVAEGLKAVDARRAAHRGAVLDDLEGRRHDLRESFAKLIEQTGPAGHRVPQDRIHVVAPHVADHEDLQIVHVHVEHARGTEAHRLQDAVGGRRVFASGKRKRVGGHVRVEADGFRCLPAPLGMGRAEILALALRRERGDALPAHRADRIAELSTAKRARVASGTAKRPRVASGTVRRARIASGTTDGSGGTHVDEPHTHPAPDQHRLPTPAQRLSAAVLAELQPVHGDTQLETQVLLVGNVRRMNQIGVAYRHGPQNVSAQHRPLAVTARCHCLPLGGDFVERHLGVLLTEVAVKATGHEAVAVGIDEVAGNVLAQGGRGRPRQAEVHGPGTPERNLRPADHRSGLESVAGEEPLRGQHVERVEVVVPLGLASRPLSGALEPLHEAVAAAEQRLVLGVEGPLAFAPYVEAPNLLHCPAEPTVQARDDGFQVVGKRLHMGAEHGRGRHAGIALRPSQSKHPLHVGGQDLRIALHEIAQCAQVERCAPHFAPERARAASGILEQVWRDAGRQTAGEHVPNLVPFGLGPPGVASVSVQAGDDRRMNVLCDHRLVTQVEGRRVDPAGEQLERIGEVSAIVGDGTAVGDVHRHAMTASCPSGPLPVVGRQRRHVSHEHGIELTDVDAELQGRSAHQAIDRIRRPLEQVLQPFAFRLGDHGGVLLRAQHRVGAVEKLEVVVVVVFPDPLQNAVAPPCGAAAMGQVPAGGAAAAPAALDAPVRVEAQPVRVHLVDAVHVRQRTALRALEPNRHQQLAVDEKVEEALEERLDGLRRHVPLPGDLAHRGIATRAEPLGDQ